MMLCSLLLWNLSVQELNMHTRYNDIFASFQYDDRTDYDCYLIWNRTLYVDMSITINGHWYRNNCTDHSGWDSLTVPLVFRTLYCNGQWKGKCPLDILWQGFSDVLNHCSTNITRQEHTCHGSIWHYCHRFWHNGQWFWHFGQWGWHICHGQIWHILLGHQSLPTNQPSI